MNIGMGYVYMEGIDGSSSSNGVTESQYGLR